MRCAQPEASRVTAPRRCWKPTGKMITVSERTIISTDGDKVRLAWIADRTAPVTLSAGPQADGAAWPHLAIFGFHTVQSEPGGVIKGQYGPAGSEKKLC